MSLSEIKRKWLAPLRADGAFWLIVLAFFLGIVTCAAVLSSSAGAFVLSFFDSGFGALKPLLCGCAFLFLLIILSSSSIAGTALVPLSDLICGFLLTAFWGSITPYIETEFSVMRAALLAGSVFVVVACFMQASLRSLNFSKKITAKIRADRQLRIDCLAGFLLFFIISAVLIAAFFALFRLLDGICI